MTDKLQELLKTKETFEKQVTENHKHHKQRLEKLRKNILDHRPDWEGSLLDLDILHEITKVNSFIADRESIQNDPYAFFGVPKPSQLKEE